MASFVKMEWLDPYELLASRLRLSRRPMTLAFDEAFRAYTLCHEILREARWAQFDGSVPELYWQAVSGERDFAQPDYDFERRQYEAQVEDNLSDWQASLVLLFADDALQDFARGVLGKSHNTLDGYGPAYTDTTNSGRPVHVTTLLRAGTNAIRHVSEWDTPRLPFPYPAKGNCENDWQRAVVRNIDVIQRAFGLGIHERIRDVVSMRVLIRIDGTLGTPGIQPDYSRVEAAIIAATRDMARKAGGDATARLEAAISGLTVP